LLAQRSAGLAAAAEATSTGAISCHISRLIRASTCGETDPLVLQFDHRDGTTKIDTVGTMVNRANWNTLLAEIAKCDVRCANCHRLRTAQKFQWTKWVRESA